jgi:hypothetical protein
MNTDYVICEVGTTFYTSVSHTISYTHPVGLLRTSDRLVAEAATYATRNRQNSQKTTPSAGFEPVIPAIKRLQTYAVDRTATEIIGLFVKIHQRPLLF